VKPKYYIFNPLLLIWSLTFGLYIFILEGYTQNLIKSKIVCKTSTFLKLFLEGNAVQGKAGGKIIENERILNDLF